MKRSLLRLPETAGNWLRSLRTASPASELPDLVENSFDAVVLFRVDGSVLALNRAARLMFRCSEGKALKRRIDQLVRLPDDSGRRVASLPLPGGCLPPRRALGLRRDGSSFPLEMSVVAVGGGEEARRAVFLRDVAEYETEQRILRHRATHDALTDLPNRYLFHERARTLMERARREEDRVAFLFVDLDRFREINDALGHRTGDLLLEAVARRMDAARDESDMLCRLGGDEFAMLVPGVDATLARHKAWRLVRCLEESFQVEGLSLEVEASVGIAFFPDHGESDEGLLQRADVAMYTAKRARERVGLYECDQDSSNLRQHTLTADLRQAVERGELSLHYQPKLAAETGRLVGVEALARWEHSEFGFVPPDEFITLAEQTGVIQRLTRWVLEAATIQGAQWLREGHEFGISVNISARTLLDEDLPRLLERLLSATALPARRLTLEITESAIMEDPEKTLDVLIELYAIGVGLSIDDFGTGYSSLGYLKKLPASELKIDQSFVREMDRNQDDATIVRSIIDLAHNLGVEVVAEGVETEEIWDQLRELGCDVGQGYLFSRPLPPDQLAHWIRGFFSEAAERAAAGEREPAPVPAS
jgi:diguanylate cyclase (GGDEF)-like protein/PAS domain S-box-containing protein